MPTSKRHGGCLCGSVRFELTGSVRVHYCHCDMCRRATGSAFAVLVWTKTEAIAWTGKPKTRRSSPIATRSFCPECGTPITLGYDARPNEIALHVGVFDDPSMLIPQYNYGSGQRLDWVTCGIALPHHFTEERW